MKQKQEKKNRPSNKKWVRFRHRIVRHVLNAILKPYSRIVYGVKIEKYKGDNKRPYLVVYNHQTPFDQFFVGIALPQLVYYVTSEDLFSNGFLSSIIRYLVAPIPFKKSTSDIRAVLNCKRIAKEGATIAISPEGNRTYDGKQTYVKPGIASLVRTLKMPLLIFRIEGGYGVCPRWSDHTRKGSMRAYVARTVEPEEYDAMTNEELYTLIKEGINVDEGKVTGEFRSKKNAEYLERVVYVCPECGLSVFESHKDTVTCQKCRRSIRHLPTKELVGQGFDFPFRFVSEWYDFQNKYILDLDLSPYKSATMYSDIVRFSEVIVYKKKNVISKNAVFSLYADRFVIRHGSDETVLHFSEVRAATVLGRNKLNVYHKDKIYQFKGNKRFNALKYMNVYYHAINSTKEALNGEFLGL